MLDGHSEFTALIQCTVHLIKWEHNVLTPPPLPPQQPTAFDLQAYPLDTVFETPALITSLHNYTTSLPPPPYSPEAPPPTAPEHQASVLLLRISAAADYFTTNATLMKTPAPVLVDIILDPFVANVLPRSLVPTVGYVIVVAVVSWLLAWRVVVPGLKGLLVGNGGDGGEKKVQ